MGRVIEFPMIDYSGFAFSKPPKKVKHPRVKITKDGREICNQAELTARAQRAWEKQGGLCHYCKKRLSKAEVTADHVKPRKIGGGEREDAEWNIVAACAVCNSEKGSKRGWAGPSKPAALAFRKTK